MAVLSGLRVVEGSAFVAAPLGGLALAQLGADVIRFDAIGGGIDHRRWPLTEDGASLYWAGLNKGKRSIALAVATPEGRELATALATAPGPDAGVFLSNFPPRGWLADERLRAHRADLIYVSITGTAQGGTAVDYTVNAASGIAYANGPAGGHEPLNSALPAWDVATGLHAAVAVLAAERQRTRTGAGTHATIALADVASTMVANLGLLGLAEVRGEDRPPVGNEVYGSFGRDFATADGRRVMVVAISVGQWRDLVAATGLAGPLDELAVRLGVDLAEESARHAHRDAVAAVLAPWFAARTLAEVADALEAGGACWGPFQTFTQLLGDPRVQASDLFADVEHPGVARLRTPTSPVRLDGAPASPPAPAPRLGQHTDEVLAEVLGLSSAEIGRLHERGVVAGPG